MTHLALDLGTATGYCVGTEASHISGSWSLKPRRHESSGVRFLKFRSYLNEIKAAYPDLKMVFYEEVRRHAGVDAAHIHGALLGVVQEWCVVNGVEYEGLPVGEIKKSFTGHGNASKEQMLAEARDRGYQPKTHDEADAIGVFHLGAARLEERT